MSRRPKRQGPLEPLFLIVDKPAGRTSHDIVAILRAVTGVRRCGHTGTLDPFATGVLPLAFGAATRFVSLLDEREKVYEARIQLGVATRSGDPEGEVCETAPVPELQAAQVRAAMASLTGELLQVPPAYSAIKVDGRPLYEYARAGITVEVPPRPITVHRWDVLGQGADWLDVRVVCSRGTYVRTLGETLARSLGTVGHLIALRRVASGSFSIEQALSLDEVAEAVAGTGDAEQVFPLDRDRERPVRRSREVVRAALRPRALPLADALPGTRLVLDEQDAARLVQSGRVPPLAARLPPGHAGRVSLVDTSGLALALVEHAEGVSRPLRVVPEQARRSPWCGPPSDAPSSDGAPSTQ